MNKIKNSLKILRGSVTHGHCMPYAVQWYISGRCTHKCLYCGLGKTGEFADNLKNEELSLEKIKSVLDELKEIGVFYVAFTGGEPLLLKDIIEAIRYAKQKGFMASITTNATQLNEEVAKGLISTGIDTIGISLDYIDETHDKIRHFPGAFKAVDKAIDNLLKHMGKAKSSIGISTVVSKYNYNRLRDIFEYAKKKGISGVALQPFVKAQIENDHINKEFALNEQEISVFDKEVKYLQKHYGKLFNSSNFFTEHISAYFREINLKKLKCFAGTSDLSIFPDGSVGICPFLPSVGNLKTSSLKEILKTAGFKALCKRAKNKECPGCMFPLFFEPNIILNPVTLFKELSFAVKKIQFRK